MRWIRITKVEDIPVREVDVAGAKIAIFNLGDRFLAVTNQFLRTGGPPARGCAETYAIRVEDGVVMLELPFRDEVVA